MASKQTDISAFRARLLKDLPPDAACWAILDCAFTAGATGTDEIFKRLSDPDVFKDCLFTGETAISSARSAPWLVRLDTQPALERWVVEHAWGKSWGVIFATEPVPADPPGGNTRPLLAHLRQFFHIRAENGRKLYFRFFDPVILNEFFPMLSTRERAFFFGPILRYMVEDGDGRAMVYDRPEDAAPLTPYDHSPGGHAPDASPIDPSRMITEKRGGFAASWHRRLMDRHVEAYRNMGFLAVPDMENNALFIGDSPQNLSSGDDAEASSPAGTGALLQKTGKGVRVTTGEGRVFDYELSPCKTPLAVSDPAGERTEFDIQEREDKVTNHKQSLLSAIRMENNRKRWVFDYDGMDHLTEINYPDGTMTSMAYDSRGNLEDYTDRNGHATRFGRDHDGLLLSVTGPDGNVTRFSYDGHNAASRIEFPDKADFAFSYSEDDTLHAFHAGGQEMAGYEVDSDGNSWRVRYADGTWASYRSENGHIVEAANQNGTLVFIRDDAGNLLSETYNGRQVSYERNENGMETGITPPAGPAVSCETDNEHRPVRISGPDGVIGISYAPGGALERIDYPNRTTLHQTNTPSGLPSVMTLARADGDPVFDRRIERDIMDRVVSIQDIHGSTRYAYDRQGRLTSAQSSRPELCGTFAPDARGNRTQVDGHSVSYNLADRIDQPGFSHDALGNRTSGILPRGKALFHWQSANRLAEAEVGECRARYLYDALGRRVEKRTRDTLVRYIWAGTRLLREVVISPSGDHSYDYLYFPGTPVLLGIRHNDTMYWAAFGHRYETLCLTDASGRVAWQAGYDAFGRAMILADTGVHQPMRLAGHYRDDETGLHYSLSRYYDPKPGCFLSPDPLFTEGGSDNFYAYCGGDPINRIDPLGEALFIPILIGAAVGAAIGGGVEAHRQKQDENQKTDGFKIAKAALLGGVIGAAGGGVAAGVQSAVAATALGKSTLGAMSGAGFLTGTAGSVAEQCTASIMTDAAVPPLQIAMQALTDGVIGAGMNLVPLGAFAYRARRLAKAYQPHAVHVQPRRDSFFKRKTRQKSQKGSPEAHKQSKGKSNHRDKSTAGDPVDAVTGAVVLFRTDFEMPGRIPLAWERHYESGEDYAGVLGPGWQTPADARLVLEDDFVVFYDGTPGGAVFEALPDHEPRTEMARGGMLYKEQDGYAVRVKSGITYHFGADFADGASMVRNITDASGNMLSFLRENGALIRISDSAGQAIDIACEHGRIASMTLGERLLVRYRYKDGLLAAAQDPMGRFSRYSYDAAGRMTSHTNRNGLGFYYEYDKKGRCIHSYGDDGLYDYRFGYPPYRRVTIVTDSVGGTWEYHYDTDRLPVKVVDPNGGAVEYRYDEVGRLTGVTDPMGHETCCDYDGAGNPLEITRPDNSRIAVAYDDEDRPIQVMDPNDGIHERRYDEKGRLTESISPLGHSTTYAYDANGDLLSVIDPEGNTTRLAWDRTGNLLAVTRPTGATTRLVRDRLGNITAITDPDGKTTRYHYDENARLNRVVSPSGATRHFEWDPESNLTVHTDASGRRTRFEYTGLNELSRRIQADGTVVSYDYDTEERLVRVTNEKGQAYEFGYDPAGNMVSRKDYYAHTHQYEYDLAGRVIRSIDPLEREIRYAHDSLGRLTQKRFESGESEAFIFDPAGSLVAFESPDSRVERIYDADGNLAGEQNGSFLSEYRYDACGRRTSRSTGFGNTIGYEYDADGLPAAIRINDNDPVNIGRNAAGQVISENLGKKITRSYGYDEDGRLTHQQIASPAERIERQFGYDPAGNLSTRSDSHKGVHRFAYDPMDRITESIDPMGQVKQYDYDPAGDLLHHLPDTRKGWRAAERKGRTYSFDAAGNLAEYEENGRLTRFSFDDENRLRTVRTPEDSFVNMYYDAAGRRIRKAVDGDRTFFYWDGDTLLAEKHEDKPAREYVFYPGTFEPLALIDTDGEIHYYHNDVNGLPCEVTRPNGTIVWSAVYDAFGRVEALPVSDIRQPLRMQGQYHDEETGLFYNRHRYFDPHTCAFISQDPIGLAGGENVYAYAPNVWGWVDPLGLCKDNLLNFKNFAQFNEYFSRIGNRNYRRNLFFNEYNVDSDKFFGRKSIQKELKAKGALPYSLADRKEQASFFMTDLLVRSHGNSEGAQVVQFLSNYGVNFIQGAPGIYGTPAGQAGTLISNMTSRSLPIISQTLK